MHRCSMEVRRALVAAAFTMALLLTAGCASRSGEDLGDSSSATQHVPTSDSEASIAAGPVAPGGQDLVAPGQGTSSIAAEARPIPLTLGVLPGQLERPTDIAAAPDGSVYVIDEGASRVVHYGPDGALLHMWGAQGTDEGRFNPRPAPHDQEWQGSQVAVGATGVVFTYDAGNGRVQKFTSGGQFYTSWPATVADMAGSPIGTLFAFDPSTALVKHFCPAGRLKGQWGEGGEGMCGPYEAGVSYRIVVASDQSVIIARPGSGDVDRCTRTGEIIERWNVFDAVQGTGDWQGRIAIAPDDGLVVTEVGSEPFVRYDLSGRLLDETPTGADAAGRGDSEGALDAWPDGPIAASPDGSVFGLAKVRGETEQATSALDGTVSRAYEVRHWNAQGDLVNTWGTEGAASRSVRHLAGIAVAPDGTLVVSDAGSDQLLRLGPSGELLHVWGERGSAPGHLAAPSGVAVGVEGEVYVADSGNDRVQLFDVTGGPLRQLEGVGPEVSEDPEASEGLGATDVGAGFDQPLAIALRPDGSLAIIDRQGNRVQVVDGAGRRMWGTTLPAPTPAVQDGGSPEAEPPEGQPPVAESPEGQPPVAESPAAESPADAGREPGNATAPAAERSDLEGETGLDTAAPGAHVQVASGSDGEVYVTDTSNGVVWLISPDGNSVATWPEPGAGGTAVQPAALATAPDGTIVVADAASGSIIALDQAGSLIETLFRNLPWPQSEPVAAMAVAEDGRIFVATADSVWALDPARDESKHWVASQTHARLGSPGSTTTHDDDAASPPSGAPDGAEIDTLPNDAWLTRVFDNEWLSGAPATTTLSNDLDFDWGTRAPSDDISPNGFSVRFERVIPLEPGEYEFEIHAVGGARLWLDEDLVVDLWQWPDVDWNTTYISEGAVVARVEYVDRGGPAAVSLDWSRDGAIKP